jgi:hypothetical protein
MPFAPPVTVVPLDSVKVLPSPTAKPELVPVTDPVCTLIASLLSAPVP